MVMKSSGKTTVRLFKKHLVRLITIIAIVLVSVSFMSGLGEVENRIKIAINNYYKEQNVSDIYIKSASAFTLQDINYFYEKFGEENVQTSFCYESEDKNGKITRIYSYNLKNAAINKLQLVDGQMPSSPLEILAERQTDIYAKYSVGDKVSVCSSIDGIETEYIVSGIVINPLALSKTDETSFMAPDRSICGILYLNNTIPIINDIHVTLQNRHIFQSLSSGYKNKINGIKKEIYSHFEDNTVSILSLYENRGIYSIISYAEKVGLIGIIFVIFFMLITLLVVHSNISRLLDEERGQIACLKTLGYSDGKIIGKYILFALFGTVIGGVGALPIGLILTSIIYSSFNMQYAMPAFPGISNLWYYLGTFAIIIAAILFLSIFTGKKTVRQKPVTLLTPKAPKSGKKTILEHIGIIWNKLSFKYKSTLRNVLLFKSRFIMTVLSIIGSTVLVLAGFGLMDCSFKTSGTDAIIAISAALIVFSGMLCALVIYNLTNINVSERNREIATLMVLGYHDNEVTGYIFREIYIMSFIGAVIGIPVGLGFLYFVFNFVNFGAISDINWWTWIVAPAVTMLFSFLSTLLLRRKIINTDMNASLKILE